MEPEKDDKSLHECGVCHDIFSRSKDLEKHIVQMHPGLDQDQETSSTSNIPSLQTSIPSITRPIYSKLSRQNDFPQIKSQQTRINQNLKRLLQLQSRTNASNLQNQNKDFHEKMSSSVHGSEKKFKSAMADQFQYESEQRKVMLENASMNIKPPELPSLDSVVLQHDSSDSEISAKQSASKVKTELQNDHDAINQLDSGPDHTTFTCGVCYKSFNEMGRLEVHLMICSAEKYECNVCGKFAENREELRKHKKLHVGDKKYQCKLCDASFALSDQLHQHLLLHSGFKPYPCNACGKVFRERGHLWKHKKTHTEERPYTCPVCGKSFRQSGFMPIHMRTHTKEKPYKCEYENCDKAFASSTQLTKHRRTHTGEKNYLCNTCGKAFSSATSLRIHERNHTGYRPFSCEFCNMKFASKSHQISHVRTHTGERPFVCELCNKTFACSSHLTRHKMTHSGEKPFHCGICFKSFATSYYLQIHISKHTKEAETVPQQTPKLKQLPKLEPKPSEMDAGLLVQNSGIVQHRDLDEGSSSNFKQSQKLYAPPLIGQFIEQSLIESEKNTSNMNSVQQYL